MRVNPSLRTAVSPRRGIDRPAYIMPASSANRRPIAHIPYVPLLFFTMLSFVVVALLVMPEFATPSTLLYLLVVAVGAILLYLTALRRVDPAFPAALFALALTVKLIASVGRYWMIYSLYDGGSDTPLYYEHGQILAQYFRHFDFSIISNYRVRGEGTNMLAMITGMIYSILPINLAGSFFLFATLAFTGIVFCYQAARVAWPDADLRVYTLLIFFAPSVLFWPSSLGKDAWILCWTGLVLWGWVCFVRRQQVTALLWIVLALIMLQLVRPHIAAFAALSMGGAYLLYSTRGQRSFIAWIVGAIVIGALGFYMLQAGASFLKLEEISFDSLQERMAYQQQQTTQGGSRFTAISIFSPIGLAKGLLTAAIRPFPWEAKGSAMLLISLETLGWLALCWSKRHNLWRQLRNVRSDPVTAFAGAFALVMLLALTSFGNFGIIARYRVMALPFLWMLFI